MQKSRKWVRSKCVSNAFDVNDLESRGNESIENKKIIPH
jgi:hypothetical protein